MKISLLSTSVCSWNVGLKHMALAPQLRLLEIGRLLILICARCESCFISEPFQKQEDLLGLSRMSNDITCH